MRSLLCDRPADSVVYLSGVSNDLTRAAAEWRQDLGVLVTPLRPNYLAHVPGYPLFGIDNGVFSKATPFDPAAFKTLVRKAAVHRGTCAFVVCPDVVGSAAGTLARWREWADWRAETRAAGLPVAFVLQDGCELDDTLIPWGEFDVAFIGGSTDWKIGRVNLHQQLRVQRRLAADGVPVHMGRVNSWERLELAYWGAGCKSADGTYLAFGPRKNFPKLLGWLNRANAPRRPAEPWVWNRRPRTDLPDGELCVLTTL